MIIKELDLQGLRNKHQKARIILALGSFDLLHCGHLEYLRWCKQQGDILVVSINCDREIRFRKGKNRPIIKERERVEMVDALRFVDYTLLAEWLDGDIDDVSYRVAHKLNPNAVALYCENAYEIPRWQKALPAIEVVVDSQSKINSTTKIIDSVITKHWSTRLEGKKSIS